MSHALPERIVSQAIGWAVRLDHGEPTAAQRADFETWLRADARHQAAWQRVGQIRNRSVALPAEAALDTLRSASRQRSPQRRSRRAALKLLGGAGVAAAAGWTLREHAPWEIVMADASTGFGERRVIRPVAGVELLLNAGSAVDFESAGEQAVVRLRRGEVRADIDALAATASPRGQSVDTPLARISARSAQFVARLADSRLLLGVIRGSIEVRPNAGGKLVVRAGEGGWLAPSGVLLPDASGLQRDAWAQGAIAGDNVRLADFAAELARYRRGILDCDPRVADLRVSGVFQLADTDAVLRTLARTKPVQLVYRTRFWVGLRPA